MLYARAEHITIRYNKVKFKTKYSKIVEGLNYNDYHWTEYNIVHIIIVYMLYYPRKEFWQLMMIQLK